MNIRQRCSHVLVSIILAVLLSITLITADEILWENIGPGGGGNIATINVSPHDPNVVLAGSDVGGIYYSGDGGQTWEMINEPLAQPHFASNYGITPANFAFHPTNQNRVHIGPFVSDDGGQTWTVIEANYNDDTRGKVTAIDPNAPDTYVYVGTRETVARSDCAWGNCTPLLTCINAPDCDARIQALLVNPANSMEILACSDKGIFKSTDRAVSFQEVTDGMGGNVLPGCNRIVLDEANDRVYATRNTTPHEGVNNDPWVDIDTWQGGVHQSTTFGDTWTDVNGQQFPPNTALPNADFELPPNPVDPQLPPDGWVEFGTASAVERDCTVSHSGSCSVKITVPGGNTGINTSPRAPVDGGEVYRLSAWFKVDNGAGLVFRAKFAYYDAAGQPTIWPGVTWNTVEPWNFTITSEPTFGWRRLEARIRPPSAAVEVNVQLFTLGTAGTVWFDDASLSKIDGLPRVAGKGQIPSFLSYSALAVDPETGNLYVGAERSTFVNERFATDTSGVYKAVENPPGVWTWEHITRIQYQDNVLDNGQTMPVCGDSVCGGRRQGATSVVVLEDCNACAQDCDIAGFNSPDFCCGDGVCSTDPMKVDEDSANCPADCPFEPDPTWPNPGDRPYHDVRWRWDGSSFHIAGTGRGGSYGVWAISTGAGMTGHDTVFFGSSGRYKSINGGGVWEDMGNLVKDPPVGEPLRTWQGRGDTTDVFVTEVVTDARVPERIYYGDFDNQLQVSYDGGGSFAYEGFQWNDLPVPVFGGSATSIVLDPVDTDRIYIGVGTAQQGSTEPQNGGALIGTFDPSPADGAHWTWSSLGDQSTFPKGVSQAKLLRDASGEFYAAVFRKGVYSLADDNPVTQWTHLSANWSPEPKAGTDWTTTRIAQDAATGRLYVAAGNVEITSPPAADTTGVWESNDDGATWTKITDMSMDGEPVMFLLPVGSNTLFVGTWYAFNCSPGPNSDCFTYDTEDGGGLYKGTRDGGGAWSWTRVIAQPRVSGAVVSDLDSSVLYASAGQVGGRAILVNQAAGVYKSTDGGDTWALLTNNGLEHLGTPRLYFSASDPLKLYASSRGSGLFMGTIVENADVETIVDGASVSGSLADLSYASSDDTYRVIDEANPGPGHKNRLEVVYTFTGTISGANYDLVLEGFNSNRQNDDFDVGFATSSTASCSGVASYQSLFLVTKTVDDDQLQTANLGSSADTTYCIRIIDTKRNGDKDADQLSLDRLVLFPPQS